MRRGALNRERDLLLEIWRVRTEEQPMHQLCAQICAQTPTDQLQ
ncbi:MULTISPECIES: hypothetical protein [unclassified Synechococcus]|nr:MULTISPECIES: hypothetical protein [unclassified Synechococcus]